MIGRQPLSVLALQKQFVVYVLGAALSSTTVVGFITPGEVMAKSCLASIRSMGFKENQAGGRVCEMGSEGLRLCMEPWGVE